MKRTLTTLALAALMLLALVATPAQAEEGNERNQAIVVWEMPSWDDGRPTWPQQYYASIYTLDGGIGAWGRIVIPCGYYQVDVYRWVTDEEKQQVFNLIDGGVLYGPQNPPEPLIPGGAGVAWLIVNNGECPPPTTTTTTKPPTTTTIPATTTTTMPVTTTSTPGSVTTVPEVTTMVTFGTPLTPTTITEVETDLPETDRLPAYVVAGTLLVMFGLAISTTQATRRRNR